ncbi:glutathione S-transferase domain-containing protein [Polychytrium aggregatum]|uniref:glutathione S-transferase domain-containing protein n=1 Tax=Polychytrium aggregatum TaxID=110093 RepID=UPI0022FF2188|nr:glutathione S-transferase domain-containing protein [Polychytrium aggregatum]KAI9205715.1 glutathione S-transferase domain-containing protein [Polychytrium aggregatum]
MATVILHHLNNSRSQRIIWFLEELGVNYEIKKYMRGPDKLAPKELREVHPLGKSPVITDGDLTIAESGAIVEYLGEKYGNGKFVPTQGTRQYYDYKYWLHFAEGSMMPPLVMSLVFSEIERRSPWLVSPITRAISNTIHDSLIIPGITNQLGFIEQHLSKNAWFAGDDISGADIQMSFPVEAVLKSDRGNGRLAALVGPNTKAWMEKIHARPAYKRGLEKGGEYAYA